MIDYAALQDALAHYKRDFVGTIWPGEKYKWRTVKHFQDHWRIDAPDFAAMLSESLARTANLLTSRNFYPRAMIEQFAEADPERVRAMFSGLFDESADLAQRFRSFMQESAKILARQDAKSDYQTDNTISTYLWLRYPDRYYIYKWSEARAVAERLSANMRFKRGDSAKNVADHLALYDEICAVLQSDPELRSMLTDQLDDNCYPDPELRTLTIDVAFYISRSLDTQNDDELETDWWPSPDEYHPGLSVDDWEQLLRNREVFTQGSLEVVKRFKDISGAATCSQLASRYGKTANTYNLTSTLLAKRVLDASGVPVPPGSQQWPVLYTGRRADRHIEGTFVWRLRDELSEALDRVDLSDVPLYAEDGALPEDEPSAAQPAQSVEAVEVYSEADFLAEVFMSPEDYRRLVQVLRRKKNVILKGPPGVGKTFAANRLAWSMMGEKDHTRVQFVQFHQNYSYEDFVMGYKPADDGFALQRGIFHKFCTRAATRPDVEHFFIIDEINRGNMSKIFGELLMLIENDYRGTQITLAYDGTRFSVPENVHIIGMMNTADRSLAMIDYALRRRFSFIPLSPGFDTEGFRNYQAALQHAGFDSLVRAVQQLNSEIADDPSLGSGFRIGHSYFCGAERADASWLRSVVDYDLIPMIEEYWFDSDEKVGKWRENLRDAIRQ